MGGEGERRNARTVRRDSLGPFSLFYFPGILSWFTITASSRSAARDLLFVLTPLQSRAISIEESITSEGSLGPLCYPRIGSPASSFSFFLDQEALQFAVVLNSRRLVKGCTSSNYKYAGDGRPLKPVSSHREPIAVRVGHQVIRERGSKTSKPGTPPSDSPDPSGEHALNIMGGGRAQRRRCARSETRKRTANALCAT